ncbi:CrcB-like protein-domain-containing protein [Rhodocollybia butyracea]|uniref:CrcB-like protein-domain-containing protein n=1 Tax=Rhodocollybia butyracea TaxID=206335 RepID=A0A9P5UE00_9AGAR|nr:CrcB-like protein-domain-containing protein [Rhodocollybia butyracea]
MFPLMKMGKEDNGPPSRSNSHRQVHTSIHDVGSDVSLASVDVPPLSRRNSRQSSHHDHELPRSATYHPLAPHVLLLFIPASIFGVLARLGLEALVTYDGQSIFPLAYVQGLGCFVMGFSLEMKESMGNFYPPLYTALTTGFCGSLTTFSSWQLDVFSSWLNSEDTHRSGLQDFIDGLGKTVFTLVISITSLSFGGYIARIIHPYLPTIQPPTKKVRYAISAMCILFYVAALLAYFLLPTSYRHQATAALLFAFPGTLTRYLLSTLLNPLLIGFPLGTFAANSTGTSLLAAFHVIQSIASHPISPNMCSLVQGLSDGYCGCLTTVSTFAAEIRVLRRWEQLRYAWMSWGVGQLLILIIMGPSLLSGNVHKQQMCSFD